LSYRLRSAKTVLTCLGHVTVGRRYYACRTCRTCRAKQVPWDVWAGIPGGHRLTTQARRVVTVAGTSWSFEQASARLAELCLLNVSNDVIRAVCDEEGEAARRWMNESPEPAAAMAKAAGGVEFYTDGVKVNTVDGWREMRLSVFAKREAGGPATPGQWRDRVLPEPTARVAACAIAPSHCVGSSWRRMLAQLGLERCPGLSVLADGAKWIWDEAAKRFKRVAGVDWCVDVFHVSQHLHACAKRMFGADAPGARLWAATRIGQLMELQGPAFIEQLRGERAAAAVAPRDGNGHLGALDDLLGYLTANRDSLWYRTRLAQGKPIGSGLIEGACKNTIGARLKINNPRWRVRRAERMGTLRCLQYSDLWNAYWLSKTG
jgi:hypothetical protein